MSFVSLQLLISDAEHVCIKLKSESENQHFSMWVLREMRQLAKLQEAVLQVPQFKLPQKINKSMMYSCNICINSEHELDVRDV